MQPVLRHLLHPCLCLLALATAAHAEENLKQLRTTQPARDLYDTGLVWNCMRVGEGIGLSDLVLFENDAPGAGRSEQGEYTQPLHRGILARKTIVLEDPSAFAAHLVIYMTPRDAADPAPWHVLVNGRRIEGPPLAWHEPMWHWVPLPADLLQEGDNSFVLGCDASPDQGYDVLFAREDEYPRGGGAFTYRNNTALITAGIVEAPTDPMAEGFERIAIGETSAISRDGGNTWKEGLLGENTAVQGELSMRLSLQRHPPEGTLVSAPLDLWGGGVVPTSTVQNLRLHVRGDTPPGTSILASMRFSETNTFDDAAWSKWIVAEESTDPPARFLQIRIQLQTEDPLLTPTLHALEIERTVSRAAFTQPLFLVASENPPQRVSSYWRDFQNMDHPALREVRERLQLHALLEGAHGDFEKINRVRHHVSQLWYHALPYPEYPEWDARAVLDRNKKHGWGGMCMQFVVVFMQALQSLGYHARHVNLFNHESCEVWVDELGKWVLVDPESVFDSYEFNTQTGQPLSALEQHQHFLARYGFSAQRPIPWASPEPWCNWPPAGVPETPQPLDIATATPWISDPDPLKRPPQHNLAGFVRIVPRNDFLDRPTPRPLNNGSTFWPWSGYVCWYDAATPRKLQYALHSDREADFYPTLNRVHFTLTREDEGVLHLAMTTQSPGFETFEINLNDTGWIESGPSYQWRLRPSALNRLQMRTRNKLGVVGKPSEASVMWHYQAPFEPKEH